MPSPPPLRVLLIEDNLLTRIGTATLLQTQPDLQVVGQAPDGAAGFELYRTLRPDVVIADLRMPGLDGVALTEALIKESPPGHVLVLTHYDGDETIFRAVRAGALGYVTKDAEPAELFEAVRLVARGKQYLPAAIAAKLTERSLGKGLSPREQQVLELLAEGLANKEVADRLDLAEKTIQLYVTNLLAKLGAHSRTEAVMLGIERGFLAPPAG